MLFCSCVRVAFEPVFVDEKTLNKIVQGAPSRSKGSQHLFRDMWNDGWSYLSQCNGCTWFYY